ncbi:ImuA family protein [Rhodobacter sp. NSM]|uniref:ImuA family protein n=1 Tax=Rhodobacter sp. NSM TaxID=3457501 RepID=UPI003FD520B7
MTTQLLDRHGARVRPMQRLVGDLSLSRARVHEFCGPARRLLALVLMAGGRGPVVWIHPGWRPERLYPDGMRDFAEPGRLILARARRPEDLLWSMEEALRSGAVPLVVAELPEPPPLTPVRRLHLAAEAGAETAAGVGADQPIGILLTPGDGGSAGIETRWRLAPFPEGRWRLDRLRARMEPPAGWILRRGDKGLEIERRAPA